jgi:predicted dehydrogenase
MTRVAVIGAGSFGKNHVRVVSESTRADLAFVVDPDPSCADTSDYRDVIGHVDAAILAVPTILHADIGCALLEAGIDVLVEKPIAPTLHEADRLVEAAARNGRILQVGHLERFNPAVIALERAATYCAASTWMSYSI